MPAAIPNMPRKPFNQRTEALNVAIPRPPSAPRSDITLLEPGNREIRIAYKILFSYFCYAQFYSCLKHLYAQLYSRGKNDPLKLDPDSMKYAGIILPRTDTKILTRREEYVKLSYSPEKHPEEKLKTRNSAMFARTADIDTLHRSKSPTGAVLECLKILFYYYYHTLPSLFLTLFFNILLFFKDFFFNNFGDFWKKGVSFSPFFRKFSKLRKKC